MKHWWMYNHYIELAVNYLRQILVTSGPLTVWGKKENVLIQNIIQYWKLFTNEYQ